MTEGTRLEALLALRRRELAEALAALMRADALLADADRALYGTRDEVRALADRARQGEPRVSVPAGWLACRSALHACDIELAERLAAKEETCLRAVAKTREGRDCAAEAVARAVRAVRAVEHGIAVSRKS